MAPGIAWPSPSMAPNSALVSEIQSLRRERDELIELVRVLEADLSPRARGDGTGSGGRARSLERRLDLERLWAAQEATATAHPSHPVVGVFPSPRTSPDWEIPWRPPAAPPDSFDGRGHTSAVRRANSWGASRRRAPSGGDVPSFGSMPRGTGRRGLGPEGTGSGTRSRPHRKLDPAFAQGSPRHLHPPRLYGQPPIADMPSPRKPTTTPSPRRRSLEDALDEALRGLGGARGALADATRQLNQEAHRRTSEAWRLHRLEQVMAASLGGFGRELRSLRVETARGRGEAGAKWRARSSSKS